MVAKKPFVTKWIDCGIQYTGIGYWIHALHLVTGEVVWYWEGRQQSWSWKGGHNAYLSTRHDSRFDETASDAGET
jgi:hypothetical protein